MTPTISKELQEQIEREAETYMHIEVKGLVDFEDISPSNLKYAYEAGATTYAPYKERFEQAKKAIEAFKITFNDKSKSAIELYKKLDNLFEVFASWKEEGKEVGNG